MAVRWVVLKVGPMVAPSAGQTVDLMVGLKDNETVLMMVVLTVVMMVGQLVGLTTLKKAWK